MSVAGSHHAGHSGHHRLTVVRHPRPAAVAVAAPRPGLAAPQVGHGQARMVRLTLLALAIVGAGVIVGELLRRPLVPAARFDVVPVTRGDLQPAVRGAARVEPWHLLRVRAAVDGRIRELRVREGDRVRTGDVLATLERRPLALAVRRADAQLAVAQAAALETELRMSRALEELDDRGEALPDHTDALSDSEMTAAVA